MKKDDKKNKEGKDQLSYILLTPYTVVKSRTGGVVSRLLSRLDLELVAAQMIAPSADLAREYAKSVLDAAANQAHKPGQLLHDYIIRTFTPSEGRRHRVLMLLFKGENAVRKLCDICGALFPENLSIESMKGETIRDTYADLVYSKTTPPKVEYFEPAVLTPYSEDLVPKNLKLFADFIQNEKNLVENMSYPDPKKIEQTLVIIKPDNWQRPSSRPGTIIDMFSRTGLRIIGVKLYQMSVAEALEFYGPVQEILRKKLSPYAGDMARKILEEEFNMKIPEQGRRGLISSFGIAYAEEQFSQIIEFMSGYRPDECPEESLHTAGRVKCLVLVYEGEDAINKIRAVLGPTDPTKAPGGTVRRDFGSDVMINTAHASDSVENAKREMSIVNIQQNNMVEFIKKYLKSTGN